MSILSLYCCDWLRLLFRANYYVRQSSSPDRRAWSPEREHMMNKGDSLDELRHGNLVAQNKDMFSRQDSDPERYMPGGYNKAYAVRKPEVRQNLHYE